MIFSETRSFNRPIQGFLLGITLLITCLFLLGCASSEKNTGLFEPVDLSWSSPVE